VWVWQFWKWLMCFVRVSNWVGTLLIGAMVLIMEEGTGMPIQPGERQVRTRIEVWDISVCMVFVCTHTHTLHTHTFTEILVSWTKWT
jgi:hypothetical protein